MNNSTLCSPKSCTSHSFHWAMLILRVIIALVFIQAGYFKLFGGGMGMFTTGVAGLGFPFPVAFAYVAALTEFLGGIVILFGVLTRYASVLLAIVMIVVIAGVKQFSLSGGYGDYALLGILITLFLLGPGHYALFRGKHRKEEDCCNSSKSCCADNTDTCCKNEA